MYPDLPPVDHLVLCPLRWNKWEGPCVLCRLVMPYMHRPCMYRREGAATGRLGGCGDGEPVVPRDGCSGRQHGAAGRAGGGKWCKKRRGTAAGRADGGDGMEMRMELSAALGWASSGKTSLSALSAARCDATPPLVEPVVKRDVTVVIGETNIFRRRTRGGDGASVGVAGARDVAETTS